MLDSNNPIFLTFIVSLFLTFIYYVSHKKIFHNLREEYYNETNRLSLFSYCIIVFLFSMGAIYFTVVVLNLKSIGSFSNSVILKKFSNLQNMPMLSSI